MKNGPRETVQLSYRISSNKSQALNKRRPLIIAVSQGIHIEISASL